MKNTILYPSVSTLLVTLCALVASGCGGGDEDTTEVAAAQQSLEALRSTLDTTYLIERVMGPSELLGLIAVEDARPQLFADMRDGLTNLVSRSECASVTEQSDSSVTVVLDQCSAETRPLSGEIGAQISFETRPCVAGECPTAVTYTLDPYDIDVDGKGIAGSFSLRLPVDRTAPRSTEGSFLLYGRQGGTAMMNTRMEWQRGQLGLCVELRWEAELLLSQELQETIGTDVEVIAASGEGITRCGFECPRQGTIRIAFDRGDYIQLDYTGGPTAILSGAGGRRREITLDCRN